MAKKLETLRVADLVVDHEFQSRVETFTEEELQETMQALSDSPGSMERISVVKVASHGLIVTDGFRRVAAHERLKLDSIPATVETGSLLDAMAAACRANVGQVAKPIGRKDRLKAIAMYHAQLTAANQKWSAGKIAETIQCSTKLVAEYLKSIEVAEPAAPEGVPIPEEKVLGADGKHYPKPKPKPKKAAVPTPEPSLEDGGWEATPLAEFIDCDDYIQKALDKNKVVTAGDLYKRAIQGETFGLRKTEVQDLVKACEDLRDNVNDEPPAPKPAKPPEPPKQGTEVGFPYREFDLHYGYIARGVDDHGTTFPHSPEFAVCERLLREFRAAWDGWVKRLPPGAK